MHSIDIADFLENDPNLDYIDFYLEALHINGRDFRQVGSAVRAGRIITIMDPSLDGYCLYAKDTDAICVPRDFGIGPAAKESLKLIFQASVVHESVHAACDMNRCVGTSPLSEEVAGYLAQQMYVGLADHWRNTFINSTDAAERAIFDAARRLIVHFMRDSAAPHGIRRGVRLHANHYGELRQAVSSDPLYFKFVGARLAPSNNGIRPRG